MRRKILVLVLALGCVVPAAAGQQVDWSKKARQAERSRTYDALHYRIVLRLDLEQKSFEGRATVSVTSLREGLQEVVLDAEEFSVSRVVSDWGEPLAFEQSPTQLTVHMKEPLRLGETRSFTCDYKGTDPKVGLRFVAASGATPAMVFSDSWPDHVHHWFPCFDYPNDKATSEIVATVKSGLKVAANGRLLGVVEDNAAGTVTYDWSQELPHSTYLVFLAAAPYVVVHDWYKSMPVDYWVFPNDADKAMPTYGKTPKMIEFFNRTFGFDYPWQKYDQISVPSGGGAESTSATAMTASIMVDAKQERDFPAIGIVSHELAHQWWGDLITLRSWAHTWMNESFGTYSDYLYHRYEMGEDEGALNLQGKLNAYLREAKTKYVRPIVTDRYDQPAEMFDSHTYPKGALVLHMLRNLLGDEQFFLVLKRFLHVYAFQPVDTNDFTRTVKEVTGRNLDWFYDQWLFAPGHPVFDVRTEWDPARKVVVLRIAQVQDYSRGIPVFKVPVAVAIVTAKGKTTSTVWMNEKEQRFEFPADTKPLMVRFDEGNVLVGEVTFPKTIEELLYQLRNDDVIGRMSAARGLVEFGSDTRVFDALSASARTDAFWAVRQSAVEALGKQKDARAAAVLREIGSNDSNPTVCAAALAALGDLGDRRLASYFRERFEKDDSERVRTAALAAIGKTGDAALVPFLEQCVRLPSYRNNIGRAATEALGRLRQK